MRWLVVGCVAVVLLGLGVPPVLGSLVEVEVDEILYQHNKPEASANVTDPTALAGTVEMVCVANQLTVILTNTSGDTQSKGAMNLLTGLGFTLPDGVDILNGSVSMLGSTAINFIAPGDDDVSTEWAYTNSVTGGHFFTVALSDVDTVLSSLKADGKTQFALGSINTGTDHGGVDFGLLMDPSSFGKVFSDIIGSQEAIQDKVTFTLSLSGTVPGNLVELIDAEPVVLNFGSPDTSSIPEPSTLALFCMGVLVLPLYGRRKKM